VDGIVVKLKAMPNIKQLLLEFFTEYPLYLVVLISVTFLMFVLYVFAKLTKPRAPKKPETKKPEPKKVEGNNKKKEK
jgi:hypothetical protein